MKKAIIIIVLVVIVLISIIVGGIVLFLGQNTSKSVFKPDQTKKLVSYESELIEMNFNEYVVESFGSIEKHINEEDYAYVKFKIDSSKIEAFQQDILEHMFDITNESYSNYNVEELTNDTINLNPLKCYEAFRSGKIAKTRDLHAYLYTNDKNEYYFYIIG